VHFASLYLHHIGLVYNYLHQSSIIHAFLDDFWDFPTKSPPWYLISRRHKISCFHILMFQGPYGPQFDRGFLQRQYFYMRSTWRGRSTREEPRGSNELRWRGPLGRPRHPCPSSPRWSPRLRLLMDAFVLRKRDALFSP
jgi:hypothetical protein